MPNIDESSNDQAKLEGNSREIDLFAKVSKCFRILGIAIPATLIVYGCCFLHGFWSSFNIDFWNFISVKEVISRSLFEVLSMICFFVTWLVLYLFLPTVMHSSKLAKWFREFDEKQKGKLPEWKAKHPTRAKILGWAEVNSSLVCLISIWLIIVGVIFVEVVLNGISEESLPGLFLFMFWGISCTISLLVSLFFKRIKIQDALVFGFLFGLVPVSCYTRGQYYAQFVRDGKEPMHRETSFVLASGKEVSEAFGAKLDEYIYIGRMGQYHFITSKRLSSTIILPDKEVKAIEFWTKKGSARKFGPFLHWNSSDETTKATTP